MGPLQYGTDRPFMMVVDYASTIRRGEQVGIIAMVCNSTAVKLGLLKIMTHFCNIAGVQQTSP